MAGLGEDIFICAENYTDLKEKTLAQTRENKEHYAIIFQSASSSFFPVGIGGLFRSRVAYYEEISFTFSGEPVPGNKGPYLYAHNKAKEIFNSSASIETVVASIFDVDGEQLPHKVTYPPCPK